MPRDEETAEPSERDRPATPAPVENRAGQGAAFGIGGFGGAFAWLHRASTREAIAGVPPGTSRGALRVVAWLAAVAGIVVIGRLLVPAFSIGWLVVALAVMFPVAARWPRWRGRT